MSWKEELQKGASKKVVRAIARAIDSTPDYEFISHDKTGGHGGSVSFTEKDPEDRHEKEPHKLAIPGTPKNLSNYLKRIPKKLKEQVYVDVSQNYSTKRPLNWEDYLRRGSSA